MMERTDKYDYIIAGSGVAGNVCAFQLAKKKQRCLILEKQKERIEKVCGGGVSYKAIRLLKEIGMDVDKLFSLDTSKIYGHVINRKGIRKPEVYCYKEGNISLGIQRKIFDQFLLEQALLMGVEVKFGSEVRCVQKTDELFSVNGHLSDNFVSAIGAKGYGNATCLDGQGVGISTQITGKTELTSQYFYYWYYSEGEDKYFWIFPIGNERWNVGVWCRNIDNDLWQEYEFCVNTILGKYFTDVKYLIKPRIALLGTMDQRPFFQCDGIGDFAGKNNRKNGGGIINAIQSAIEYAR